MPITVRRKTRITEAKTKIIPVDSKGPNSSAGSAAAVVAAVSSSVAVVVKVPDRKNFMSSITQLCYPALLHSTFFAHEKGTV